MSIENGRCIWRGRLMPSFAAAAEPLLFLDLGDNDLAALPSEIGSLTGLIFLGLANNKLTELPLELTQLTHLAAVDLSGISSTAPTWGEKSSRLFRWGCGSTRISDGGRMFDTCCG